METLDDILAGGETVAPEKGELQPEVKQPEAEPATDSGPARDEQGRFAPKGVDDGAPPAPANDKLPPEEYKALKAEREKRQTLEARLAELEQQLQQKPAEPAPPPPSIWEDEQGAFQHFGSQIVSQATLNARLDMSEMMMRQANPDFEEMKQTFIALMKENPALQQQALADPHPWNKAYQIAKNHKTMADLGATDLETLKAKLREELAAEMATAPVKPGLPVTLSTERNVGSRTGPAWSGPPSLSDILNQ